MNDQRAEHELARSYVRAIARQERRAAQRSLIRALRTMVQPHEPHHHTPPVVAPRIEAVVLDFLAVPGGPDHTGFAPGGVC